MFTRFNSKIITLFLDPNSKENYSGLNDKKVNIILSPSLYWVKKLSLPVKYVRDAKKLLPSLFEETLPEGNYSYSAYKRGDEFFIFAYEDRVILQNLSEKGISLTNVANVYFAQSEFQDIQGALKVNEDQSIYAKDDIVILLPCCWIEESGELDFSDIKLSKHNISLQQYAHIVDNSTLYKIAAVSLVFCLLIFGEYLITTQRTQKVLELKDELFTKYNLKPTMLQNRSMLKEYKNIHTRQIKIREYISYILSLKLKGKERVSKLSLKDKSLLAEFSGVSKDTYSRIQKILKSKNVKFKADLKESSLRLEMVL